MYYEDAKSDEHELAYADLLYCYSLHGQRHILLPIQSSVHVWLVYSSSHCCSVKVAYARCTHVHAGGDIYIEHGYLFDTEDLQQHPKGQVFLKSCQLANNELVDSPGIYHSLATVIEGGSSLQTNSILQC